MFSEHTESSYKAAGLMGAGIIECDVTFTKDEELVCRHAQCDLHTTTDVVLRPEMNAKCTTPWAPGVTPKCCTTDFTLEEIQTLCAKMDSSGGAAAVTAEKYVYGGTADWRTGKSAFPLQLSLQDSENSSCSVLLTHSSHQPNLKICTQTQKNALRFRHTRNLSRSFRPWEANLPLSSNPLKCQCLTWVLSPRKCMLRS